MNPAMDCFIAMDARNFDEVLFRESIRGLFDYPERIEIGDVRLVQSKTYEELREELR